MNVLKRLSCFIFGIEHVRVGGRVHVGYFVFRCHVATGAYVRDMN